MADGQAGWHASHTVPRSDVREGPHGCTPHVLTSIRGNRLFQRFVKQLYEI